MKWTAVTAKQSTSVNLNGESQSHFNEQSGRNELSRVLAKGDGCAPIKSSNHFLMCSLCFSYSTKPMSTKLSKVDVQGEGLPDTKSYYHFIVRSYGKVKIQIKIHMFILQDAMTTTLCWTET